MEPSAPTRIPPPAWAGRAPLLRVLGQRYLEAAMMCAAGAVAGTAAMLLAENRLVALIAIIAVAGAAGAFAADHELSGLREAAAEAPVADDGSSRFAGRDGYVAAAPWYRIAAMLGLLGLDHQIGAIPSIGRPVVVGAAGLLLGLGIGAGAGARWVRRRERREGLAFYLREVPVRRTADSVASATAPTPEEAARVRRRMMSGQGLDEKDRDVLDRITVAKDEAKVRGGSPRRATERRYLVVPHPGRAVTDRSTEPPPERIDAPAPGENRLS